MKRPVRQTLPWIFIHIVQDDNLGGFRERVSRATRNYVRGDPSDPHFTCSVKTMDHGLPGEQDVAQLQAVDTSQSTFIIQLKRAIHNLTATSHFLVKVEPYAGQYCRRYAPLFSLLILCSEVVEFYHLKIICLFSLSYITID